MDSLKEGQRQTSAWSQPRGTEQIWVTTMMLSMKAKMAGPLWWPTMKTKMAGPSGSQQR